MPEVLGTKILLFGAYSSGSLEGLTAQEIRKYVTMMQVSFREYMSTKYSDVRFQ